MLDFSPSYDLYLLLSVKTWVSVSMLFYDNKNYNIWTAEDKYWKQKQLSQKQVYFVYFNFVYFYITVDYQLNNVPFLYLSIGDCQKQTRIL